MIKNLLVFVGIALYLPAISQNITSSGSDRRSAFSKQQSLTKKSPYRSLVWRNVGPDNISGRCTEVSGVTGDPKTMFASFATGGFWKTTDGGENWSSLFDDQGTQSIGSFALAPSDPNRIYLGTGESNILRASLPGMGMYRSKDGGKTWTNLGLENTSTIARIVIHPKNPDIVWVAAGGNEWSYNQDRGIYKTVNGGKSWQKVLGHDDRTGAIDLVMDPSDPDVLLASEWNRIRKRWSDPVPEDDDHLFKSTDGGKSWKAITHGLPETKNTGRIGISWSRSNPNVVYAFVDNHTPKREPKPGELDPYGRPIQVIPVGVQVYRSNDKGENWAKVTTEDDKMERFCGTYGWVFGQIRADTKDENKVYIMGLGIGVSKDGGKTFSMIKPENEDEHIHGDNHALWIDPEDPNHLINGNDGGVIVSYNGGKNWKNFFRKIPTTQFYNVTYDMKNPYNVIGSVQDEGTFMGSIRNVYGAKDTTIKQWAYAPGGEGTIIAIDPNNSDIVYSSSFYGRLMRSDLRLPDSIREKNIFPQKANDEDKHRGEWMAFTLLSPHNSKTIYHGFQYVFRSDDEGQNWKRISPDLTYNNKDKMGKTPYAINHQAITAMDESPVQKDLIYAGTDDGRIWVKKNQDTSWTPCMKGIPQNAHASRIVASAYDRNTVYLTLSNRREDDIRPYMYRSVDQGNTWVGISGNLPASPVNVIREDPRRKNVLYCGTDMGVYVSMDGGKTWSSLQGNLPASVSVNDLFIHPRDYDLVIATYGRGVWVIDDLEALFKK